MSYVNGTTHYNLPQTVGTDKRDWFDTNTAFQHVDTDLYSAKTTADNNASDITALTTRVGTAEGDIVDIKAKDVTQDGQISALQTGQTNLGNQIDDVKADTMDAICSIKEADATADYVHEVGSYFWYNDTLYITTVKINVGDTIVPNTNCNTTNVTAQVNEVKTALGDVSTTAGIPGQGLSEKLVYITGELGTYLADSGISGFYYKAIQIGRTMLLEISLSTVNATAGDTLAEVPTGYRPYQHRSVVTVVENVVGGAADMRAMTLSVGTDGKISMSGNLVNAQGSATIIYPLDF